MNYPEFTTPESLLAEESFQRWYLNEDPAAVALWDTWITGSAEHQALAAEAVALLNTISRREGIDPSRVEAAYERLQAAIKAGERERVAPLFKWRRWIAAAAIILLVAGAGTIGYFRFFSPAIATQYGQVEEQRLPDGSEVTLNAHSRISYSRGWERGNDREVWLNGEAFFHVKKTPQKSRFIVHTNRFDIIVTGTRFNAVNRGGITSVLLKEGSVTLRTKDGREICMQPGDFVDITDAAINKKQVDNNNIIAWKDRKMVFENTTMQDAAKMISEHYGVTVTLNGDGIAAKTISGILPNDNLDILLETLEATMEFKVVHTGDRIVITDHP